MEQGSNEPNEQETSPSFSQGLTDPNTGVEERTAGQMSLLSNIFWPQPFSSHTQDLLSSNSKLLRRIELKDHAIRVRENEIRIRGNEIRVRDNEITRLNTLLGQRSDDLDALRERLERQESRFRVAQQGSFRSLEKEKWITKEDSSIRSDFAKFERELRSWAKMSASTDRSTLQHASSEDLESLIAALQGSFREDDLRTPSWIFGGKLNEKVCLLFIHAMLASYIATNVFESPFYFFQEEMASLEGTSLNNKQDLKEENGFGQKLTALYNEMKSGESTLIFMSFKEERPRLTVPVSVNKSQAYVWRSETLRLLNTAKNRESDSSPSIKSRIEDMRKRMCETLSSNFLKGPVRLLIRPNLTNEELEKMKRGLNSIIFNAGEVSAHLWTQRMEINTIRLDKYKDFNIHDVVLTAHRLHQLDDDDHRLDGKPIIAVIQPAIVAWRVSDGENFDQFMVWSKAVVMVDDS